MLRSTHAASMPWSVDAFGAVPPLMTLTVSRLRKVRTGPVGARWEAVVVLVFGNGVQSEDRTGVLGSSRDVFNLRLKYYGCGSLGVVLSVAILPSSLAILSRYNDSRDRYINVEFRMNVLKSKCSYFIAHVATRAMS